MPLDNTKSNFSNWYDEVLLRAEIVDKRTPVKGSNVLMSNGYEIWERIKYHLNRYLKQTGHKFANFPLFIPENFLEREAQHFSGFTPEVAWVTHSGDRELQTKLALRPTSETIMYDIFANWIHSHNDLPMKYSQWCNIIRWDTAETRPLLRDREFLWNESHTVHSSWEEAEQQIVESMEIYQSLFDMMAISTIVVKRPDYDKFAGAEYTVAYDMPMPDGKVLQIATTHQLSDHFSKVFDVTYLSHDGETKFAYQTSYGLTTRLIAALIAVHGDDQGLVLPPAIAPTQVVIVPIIYQDKAEEVLSQASKLQEQLLNAGLDVIIDDRDSYTPGWKFSEWEMRGIPIRLELGPRDINNQVTVLVRRDTGEKIEVRWDELVNQVHSHLDDIQNNLVQKNQKMMEQSLISVETEDELQFTMDEGRKIIISGWCESLSCRDKLKETYSLDIRGHRIDQSKLYTRDCLVCQKSSSLEVYIAQAY